MSLTTTAPSDRLARSHARGRALFRRHGMWRRGYALSYRIIAMLQEGSKTRAQLAADLEVSEMTIYRTLCFLRDDLMLPISEGNIRGVSNHGYHFTRPVHLCPLCLREIAH